MVSIYDILLLSSALTAVAATPTTLPAAVATDAGIKVVPVVANDAASKVVPSVVKSAANIHPNGVLDASTNPNNPQALATTSHLSTLATAYVAATNPTDIAILVATTVGDGKATEVASAVELTDTGTPPALSTTSLPATTPLAPSDATDTAILVATTFRQDEATAVASPVTGPITDTGTTHVLAPLTTPVPATSQAATRAAAHASSTNPYANAEKVKNEDAQKPQHGLIIGASVGACIVVIIAGVCFSSCVKARRARGTGDVEAPAERDGEKDATEQTAQTTVYLHAPNLTSQTLPAPPAPVRTAVVVGVMVHMAHNLESVPPPWHEVDDYVRSPAQALKLSTQHATQVSRHVGEIPTDPEIGAQEPSPAAAGVFPPSPARTIPFPSSARAQTPHGLWSSSSPRSPRPLSSASDSDEDIPLSQLRRAKPLAPSSGSPPSSFGLRTPATPSFVTYPHAKDLNAAESSHALQLDMYELV